jgi:hypothetical protein
MSLAGEHTLTPASDNVCVPATRDPVSELFDKGAAKLLARAYANPGAWVGTRIAAPTPRHTRWAASIGIELSGPDRAPGGAARNRWMRAFIRSVYYQHKWFYRQGEGLRLGDKRAAPNQSRALRYEVGLVRLDRTPAGAVANRGRAVRIKLVEGGDAAQRAARRMPASKRIFNDDGTTGARWSNPADRDW